MSEVRPNLHPLDAVEALPLNSGVVARDGLTRATLEAVKAYVPFAREAALARGRKRAKLMDAAGRLARRSAIAHAQRHSAFVLPSADDALICQSAASPF